MRRRVGAMPSTVLLAAVALLASVRYAGAADPPDGATIMGRMKAALESDQPTVRTLKLRVSGDGGWSEVTAGQVRKRLPDGKRILTVIRTPEALRGISLLVQEASGPQDKQWIFLPAIGRVRTLLSQEVCVYFMSSDFTYADLGFVTIRPQYKLLGEVKHGDIRAYEVEEIPHETWCYSRVVTRVAKDSFLPIERRFYDPANQLWKIERWEHIVKVDGTPMPMQITMEDVQTQGRSEIEVSSVTLRNDIPDTLFQPGQMPAALASPVWNPKP